MTTSIKNNFLPPSLISNLQQVLITRNDVEGSRSVPVDSSEASVTPPPSSSTNDLHSNALRDQNCVKESVLVTNGEGIESPGLISLVEVLVHDGHFSVHVCAPQLDRSASGHSVTVSDTLAACSVEVRGATAAFEVSGNPADCVSLALSGALLSWSKPVLVISGINRGSSCGHNMFSSGAVAAAREALICGVPSICISLNWKNGESSENDLKDAANICLPLIHAAIRDIKKEIFPTGCLLNIEIPTCPIANKGFKVTRQSLWRSSMSWRAVSANRHSSAAHFMSSQQSLGIKLAQLSRDASAAGAARRLNSNRKNVEIESIGASGKVNAPQTVKKFFRLEFSEEEQKNAEEDVDIQALEDGFVAVTPLCLTAQPEITALVSEWIATAIAG